MKQKLNYILAVVFVAVAGYGVYTTHTVNVASDLALNNIEALAQSEGDPDFNCRWDSSMCICCDAYGTYLGCPCGSHNW